MRGVCSQVLEGSKPVYIRDANRARMFIPGDPSPSTDASPDTRSPLVESTGVVGAVGISRENCLYKNKKWRDDTPDYICVGPITSAAYKPGLYARAWTRLHSELVGNAGTHA